MRKLSNKKNTKDTKAIYDKIKSRKKWLKRRSMLFIVFLFGVNIYAWFIFISKANLDVEGSVAAWDVNFFDGNSEIKDVVIKEFMYPGMPDFNKNITSAEFEYLIEDLTILGVNSIEDGATQEEIKESLKNDYPFIIEFDATKNNLAVDDSLTFSIFMNWKYEDTSKYYKLTKHYGYDPSVNYYRLNADGTYTIDNTITASNFPTNRLNLYVEKDDADSFFGQECANFEATTGTSCVKYKVVLKVTQVA